MKSTERPRRGIIDPPMSATPNSVQDARLSGAAELACYLGVAPLALCLLGVGLLPEFASRIVFESPFCEQLATSRVIRE